MRAAAKAMKRAAGLSCSLLALFAATVTLAEPVRPIVFPHEQSVRKPDPAARYGRLPNGMTYILQHNATPAGTASIFLRVAAGSLMETPEQRGLAHFVEHMAFNGTTHIPEGEMRRILERHGFAFGADANAFTYDTRTVYTLSAPKTDEETLDTALFIMREVAGEMILDPGAIDRERGVVLGEERRADNAYRRRNIEWDHWVYAGTRYGENSDVLGSVDIIKTAPQTQLRAFYDAWYRPELTTLIIVGDIDVDAMEAKIKATFSDWQGRGPVPEEPVWGERKPLGEQGYTYNGKGISDELGMTWIGAPETRHDSPDRSRDEAQDYYLLMIINRRLQTAALDPNSAFMAAGMGIYSPAHTSRNIYLTIMPKPGRAKEAFAQGYAILQTFRARGVTKAEIGQVREVMDAYLRSERRTWATRGNGDIANNLLASFDRDSVYENIDTSQALAKSLRGDLLSAERMNARLQTWFSGDGPILSHSGEAVSDYDGAAVTADYTALNTSGAATYASVKIKKWPYGHFGPKVVPFSHTYDADFGYTRYVWPNGVTLNIKPTHLAADQIMVQVDFAGGHMRFDPKTRPPLFLPFGDILFQGGLNKLTVTELMDTLRSRQVGIYFSIGNNRATLSGATNRNSLGVEMQALMAYTTDAAYRPEPFERYKAIMPQTLQTLRATPDSVRGYYWTQVLNDSDPRFDQTRLEHIDDIRFEDIRRIIQTSLSDTPISVTIVGDVDEKAAVNEVGKTFGTLSKRPDSVAWAPGADIIAFPPPQHEFTLHHEGRDDQSVSMALWPTDDLYADAKAARGESILAAIISNRLQDELRETQGADYAPTAYATNDDVYRHNGFIAVYSTIKAGGDPDFRAALATIVTDLKTHPVNEDEMARVMKPVFDSLDNEEKTNGYWQYVVARVAGDPRARADWLKRRADFESLTPDYLMELANRYLKDDTEIFLKVIPAEKPVQ